MRYEIRQFVDDEGKLLIARIPVDSDTLIGDVSKVKYSGNYTVPHPSGRVMRIEFEFPEGWSVNKCFENYKEEADKHFVILQEESKKEASKPKLWTPGSDSGNSGFDGAKRLIFPK